MKTLETTAGLGKRRAIGATWTVMKLLAADGRLCGQLTRHWQYRTFERWLDPRNLQRYGRCARHI